MNLFGLSITRTKAVQPTLSSVPNRGGWYRIFEPFAGAWQRNIDESPQSLLSFAAVYACVALIATDIGKLRLMLVEKDQDGIWNEVESPAFSPVIRKPNRYQTRIKFFEQWMLSKLIHGNTYVLKERDNRGVVRAQYVLDPGRVKALVSEDGAVYYDLATDNLAGVTESRTVVRASEIIHDVMVPLYHPLCGVSPITACSLGAMQGLRVQSHAANFFEHGAKPGGILTAPGTISTEDAKTYQEQWEANYGGDNTGRLAVLGGGLKYEPLNMMSAVDAQLIDQLKWSAENVCTAFRVPGYMVGVGQAPAYNNIEALKLQYYGQCLQTHLESIELLEDEGCGLDQVEGRTLGTEFDLDGLLKMDTATRVKAGAEAIGSGGVSPNEARRRFFDLGPVKGGESPYLQQQNYSLEALSKRDAGPDPFRTAKPDAPPVAPAAQSAASDDEEKWIAEWRVKSLQLEAA